MSVVWQKNKWHFRLKKKLMQGLLIYPIFVSIFVSIFSYLRGVPVLMMWLAVIASIILVIAIDLVLHIPAINSSPTRIGVSEKGVHVQFKKHITHISWKEVKGIAPYNKWEIILINKKRVKLPFTDSKIKKQIYFSFKEWREPKV
jgi:hypothetical protein